MRRVHQHYLKRSSLQAGAPNSWDSRLHSHAAASAAARESLKSGLHHRVWARSSVSPICPPDAWRRATPADTAFRSTLRRHPRTLGRTGGVDDSGQLVRVAVMAGGAPRCAFFRRMKRPQGAVGGAALAARRNAAAARFGATALVVDDYLATDYPIVRAQPQGARQAYSLRRTDLPLGASPMPIVTD